MKYVHSGMAESAQPQLNLVLLSHHQIGYKVQREAPSKLVSAIRQLE